MGVEPPFIYDRPSNYSFAGPTDRGFNPKVATQASWVAPAPRPKKDGPLIEFNKHPDSYLIVPYGNLNVKPMSPKTKVKVKRLRGLQLFLRLCAMIGALGMLFCVIAINKTSGSVGWIIRVAPAVALLHTVYAVYHLSRAATGRPPASTASYMLFATMVDTGLLPFLVFSALISHSDYSHNAYGWSTLFGTDGITYKVIYTFFLLCVVEGSLFAISLFLGIYLATLFRKIAKLPPDMNPLEPTLTSRPNHKRNKSELAGEKHLSGSTVSSNKMSNTVDPMIAGTRRVPFLHTRTDSADNITLYGNDSARNSKLVLQEKEERDYRKSQLLQDSSGVSRPNSALNPAENARSAGAGLDSIPPRSSVSPQERSKKASSWLSWATADPECQPRAVSGYAALMLDQEIQPPLPVSSQHPSRSQTPEIVHNESPNWFERSVHNSQTHLPLISAPSYQQDLQVPPLHQAKKRSREPLGMNPPTPRLQQQVQDENQDMYGSPDTGNHKHVHGSNRQALHESNVNILPTPHDNSRPSSFVGSGGKSRFYGNLRRSISSLSQKDADEGIYDGVSETVSVSDYSRTRTMDSEHSHIEVYGADDDEYQAEVNGHGQQWNGARQTSNSTGYDLHAGYAGLGSEFGQGMGRRREVSGKVAEEGRGVGYGGFGATEPEVGVQTGQGKKGGAAGWARFKGL